MSSFNIFGCCICRDLFGFVNPDKHVVNSFYQSSTPLVDFWYDTKPNRQLTDDYFGPNCTLSRFQRRCIMTDYNKDIKTSYKVFSDYFILDLIHLCNTNIIKAREGDQAHYFTYSAWFDMAYKTGLKNSFFSDIEFKILNRFTELNNIGYTTVIDNMIHWLIDELGYKNEQIIIIENKRDAQYTDGEYLYDFEAGSREEVNSWLDTCYQYLESRLPGCHPIKFPDYVLGYTKHKWGLTDLHSIDEYYDYLFEAVDTITQGGSPDAAYEKYRYIILEKYMQLLKNTYNSTSTRNLLSSIPVSEKVIMPGVPYYDKFGKELGVLNRCCSINDYSIPFSTILMDKKKYHVNSDDIIDGKIITGHLMKWNDWTLINSSTSLMDRHGTAVLFHKEDTPKGQMNIIYSLDNFSSYAGKTMTFSVWVKCHETSDDPKKRGGTIGIINAPNYNEGIFLKQLSFSNKQWTKKLISFTVPELSELNGITVCIRANYGKTKHGVVEFFAPKLEEGIVLQN